VSFTEDIRRWNVKNCHKLIEKLKDQRGAVIVFVAVAVLFFLIGIIALAVDVGYLYATRNELQNIADASALAATNELGNQQIHGTSLDTTAIKDAAISVADENQAGGKDNIIILDGDIIIGDWDQGADPKFDDTPESGKEDAVKVIARRESGANGPVSTFFAKVLDHDTAPVNAYAIAALTGLSEVPQGGLPIPVGIAWAKFNSEFCDTPIKFYPTQDIYACGGWHVYEDDKTKIKQDILDGLVADPPTFESPESQTGDIFYFKGGTDNAAFEKLKELFDMKKDDNDYYEDDEVKEWPIDGDEDSETWTTTVVVYDWDNCDNPNTFIEIIGFASIRIYEICTATSDPSAAITGGGGPVPGGDGDDIVPLSPQDYCVAGEKQIVARVVCNLINPNRGGGAPAGIIGGIAGLVAPPL